MTAQRFDRFTKHVRRQVMVGGAGRDLVRDDVAPNVHARLASARREFFAEMDGAE